MKTLDELLLDEVHQDHPKSTVYVLGRFLDGTDAHKNGPVAGLVPHDSDGSVVYVDFRFPKKEVIKPM